MKKLYASIEYKNRNNARIRRSENKYKRKHRKRGKKQHHWSLGHNELKPAIKAPNDLRLLENPEECVNFFRQIRNSDNQSFIPPYYKFVLLDLSEVQEIDYASISVLVAIYHLFKSQGIGYRGNFPNDKDCCNFFKQSGFLDFMRDEKGNQFKKSEIASHIRFESQDGKFSIKESESISSILKDTSKYLSNNDANIKPIKSILIEIFGNSVEWSNTHNMMRLLGMYKAEDKVIITATDLGDGILKTIKRKFSHRLNDMLKFRNKPDILMQAFDQKYGSSTGKPNRAKGLPSIKQAFKTNKIVNLQVITNNVKLVFSDHKKSKKLNNYFTGTLYIWEVTKDSLDNTNR